jgi:hypothetical protein
MNAKEILETAKAVGRVEIAPGYLLIVGEYYMIGRLVDLKSPQLELIYRANMVLEHFIFVATCETTGGIPNIGACNDDQMALSVIKAILKEKQVEK